MDTFRFHAPRLPLLGLLLAGLALGACARESGGPATAAATPDAACLPEVHAGWIRLSPGGRAMHAGFGRIANPCATSVAVTSASSPAYADVSLHETRVKDGISRMRPVPSLPIPARGEALLQPGGLHLMLMQPVAGMAPGGQVEIAFRLEDGREVRGTFQVRAANAP